MHRRLQTVLLVVVFAALALATQAGAATWTFKASLPEGLANMGSTKGPSGLIYAIGGSSQASLVSSAHVYAYSESSNSWAMKAPLPRGRSGLGAATLGGVVYAVGGCGPRGPQSTVYLYHEGTNSWTIGTPLPARRCQVGVATSGGRLYVIGGWSSSPGTPSRSVYAFNPSTHTWSTKAQLPTTRDGFAVATDSSGRIYVIGGYCCGATLDGGAPGDEIARVDRYNPATNTWARVAGMPSGLVAPTARRASDGRIYVVGGGRYDVPDGDLLGTNTATAYNPNTNTWTTLPNLPAGYGGSDGATYAAGTALGDSGAFYVFGGRSIEHDDACCQTSVTKLS